MNAANGRPSKPNRQSVLAVLGRQLIGERDLIEDDYRHCAATVRSSMGRVTEVQTNLGKQCEAYADSLAFGVATMGCLDNMGGSGIRGTCCSQSDRLREFPCSAGRTV